MMLHFNTNHKINASVFDAPTQKNLSRVVFFPPPLPPEPRHERLPPPLRQTSRNGVGGDHRCPDCLKIFTARTGTVFERSHVPLETSQKGVSSPQLSKAPGITQRSPQGSCRNACAKPATTRTMTIAIASCATSSKPTKPASVGRKPTSHAMPDAAQSTRQAYPAFVSAPERSRQQPLVQPKTSATLRR